MAQPLAAVMIGEIDTDTAMLRIPIRLFAPQVHPLGHDEHLVLPVQLFRAQLLHVQRELARYVSLLSWIPTLDSHCRNAQPAPRLSA
jgi:hypothetical protein